MTNVELIPANKDYIEIDGIKLDKNIVSEYQTDEKSCEIQLGDQTLYCNAEEIRENITFLKTKISDCYLEIARNLFYVVTGKLFLGYDYPNLATYTEEELGMKERKAQYLVGIFAVLVKQIGIPEKDLAEMGWSKAKELVRVAIAGLLNFENSNEWIERAKAFSTRELVEYVSLQLKKDKLIETDPVHKITLNLVGTQAELFESAISIAKKMAGTNNTETAMVDAICADFLGNYSDSDDVESFRRLMARFEETFEIEITAKRKGMDDQVYPFHSDVEVEASDFFSEEDEKQHETKVAIYGAIHDLANSDLESEEEESSEPEDNISGLI